MLHFVPFMVAWSLFLIFLVEIVALANRGGGPFLSHLALTGATFGIICLAVLYRQKMAFRLSFPALVYLLFCVFFVGSLLVSLTPDYGLSEFLLFINAGILLVIFSSAPVSTRHLHWFSIGLVGLAVIDTLMGFFIYTQTPFPRFAGTFLDLTTPYTSFANDFGNFLLLILPLSAWQLFRCHERPTTTLLTVLASAILLSGFILSFSRGAWLSLIAVFIITIVWAVIHRRQSTLPISKKSAAIRGLAVLVMTVALVNMLQITRSQKFETTSLFRKASFQADEGSASASERLEFWRGAVRLMADHPWLGSGILSFKYLYPKYQPTFGANWDHPHNVFLKVGVENGVFAMLFFAFFIISVAVAAIRFGMREPWHPSVFFLLGALGSLGHNLVDYNFIVGNFTLFMVFIGLSLSFSRASAVQATRRFLTSSFLTVLGVTSLVLVVAALHDAFYNIDFKRGRALLEAQKYEEAAARLERAQALFFDRDLAHYLAAAYAGETNGREKKIQLLQKETRMSIDAALFSELGDMLLEDKKLAEAEANFQKALSLDSQNQLRYYAQLVSVQQSQRKQTTPELRQKISELLDAYQIVLRENRHFTVITDNPKSASDLYAFFGMKKEQQALEALWFQELLKFTAHYGPLLYAPY